MLFLNTRSPEDMEDGNLSRNSIDIGELHWFHRFNKIQLMNVHMLDRIHWSCLQKLQYVETDNVIMNL